MKRLLKIPDNRPLADFLPTLSIKAKDFATELTSHNVIDKNLKGDGQITNEHIENNIEVRKMLKNRGIIPENLPIAEDVKKIQRRIESEEKKVLKEVKKIQDKNKKSP
jgi:DNA-damage-inducible protein D